MEKKLKILNLYAGLGGNRTLWENCEVTAVENNIFMREVYSDRFPDDKIFRNDARAFLKKHFDEFNFIWASPPCQTHSSFRQNICVRYRGTEPEYPDMSLYQLILFLRHNYNHGLWVVENVKPYYQPLIEPTCVLSRHLFWSNFEIEKKEFQKSNIRGGQIKDLEERHSIDLSKYKKIKNKRQVLRNCVDKEIGLHILNCAKKQYYKS